MLSNQCSAQVSLLPNLLPSPLSLTARRACVRRDPVDRFLSAYEFAVETAAHQEAPATASPSARNSSKRGNNNIGSTRAQTQNVWPWSLLVPFFASDIKRRVGDSKRGTFQQTCPICRHFEARGELGRGFEEGPCQAYQRTLFVSN